MASNAKPENLRVGQVFKTMKFSSLTACIVAMGGIASAGFWFGTKLEARNSVVPAPLPDPAPSALKFPWFDGVIAAFDNAASHRPLNRLGEVFNVVMDSEWHGRSSTRYTAINEPGFDGRPGFLRIDYDLRPNEHLPGMEGYGGIWTDLSFPPPKPYDISDFKSLAIRIRLVGGSPAPRVFVALASANVDKVPDAPGYYDWCEHEISSASLRQDWVNVETSLDEFRSPSWSSRKLTLDRTRVFRLIIAVKAQRDQSISGHLDVDDIRLVR